MKSYKDKQLLFSLLILGIFAGFSGRVFEAASHISIGAPSSINSASAILATEDNLAPTVAIPPSISLGFAGNILLSGTMEKRVADNYSGDYSKLFANANFLKTDMTFAGLEGSITTPGMSEALQEAGINIVSYTGSHIFDNGQAAFENSLAELHTAGISTCGAGMTKSQAEMPGILSKDGFTVGYLCFSDIASSGAAATDTSSGILLASDPNFDTIVKAASQKVDALVVAFDFGSESGAEHNARQQQLAHEAADDGAVLVVGTHPSTPQEIASYNGTPIIYSLGNFISDQSSKDSGGIFVTATLSGKAVSNVASQTLSFGTDYVPSLTQ